MKLEVCCADIASVRAAKEGGADRVELCADLHLDGLTPSTELIREALATGIRVHVLIRSREGDFVYNEAEVTEMEDCIRLARELGVHGVVFGALTREGDIDVVVCERWVKAAGDMAITFHRAFDVCRDPLQALEQISAMGCHRLLTSGHEATALEGAALLRELVERSKTLAHPVIIMAGSGLTPDNAAAMVSATGVSEVHGSLRGLVDGTKVTTVENVQRTLQAIRL